MEQKKILLQQILPFVCLSISQMDPWGSLGCIIETRWADVKPTYMYIYQIHDGAAIPLRWVLTGNIFMKRSKLNMKGIPQTPNPKSH